MTAASTPFAEIWHSLAEEYGALSPQLSRLRAPGSNYLQLDAGGKAAHYEWKVLRGPKRHIEVALHFEGPEPKENERGLELALAGGDAAIRAGTLTPFIFGRWGGKWTRAAFQVEFADMPDEDAIKRSAALMKLLVERTYPRVSSLIDASARGGWPAA